MNSDFSSIFKPLKTAVMVDLSFFIRRYRTIYNGNDVAEFARRLRHYVYKSLKKNNDYLYRIFIYDCEPLEKSTETPISKKQILLKNTETYKFRKNLLDTLKQQPYCSVRLGNFDDNLIRWKFKKYEIFEKLINGELKIEDLTDADFTMDLKQKGVDMKIGLDMATISNKKQVEKIILITGDSDFIPAIKLARKEGIIVQLDPMFHKNIKKDLLDNLDILSSIFPNPNNHINYGDDF